jgi:hypothetical protein
MYSIEHPATRAITLLDSQTPSANDSAAYARSKWHVADANALVAGVVHHVAARVQPGGVDIALALAPGHPIIMGDPTQLAFAISGVLSAEVRAVDSHDGGTVTVELRADALTVTVVIASDELPPLSCVRALEHGTAGGAVDPTVAHCRRIVEAGGGRLELVAIGGRIGFAIDFPRLPLSTGVRVLPLHRAPTHPTPAWTEAS